MKGGRRVEKKERQERAVGGKKSDTGKTQRRIWGGTKMKMRRNRKEDESRGRRWKTRNQEGVTFTSDLTVVYSSIHQEECTRLI